MEADSSSFLFLSFALLHVPLTHAEFENKISKREKETQEEEEAKLTKTIKMYYKIRHLHKIDFRIDI